MLPSAATGTADIIVTVVASDGAVLAEARSHLVIDPQAITVPAAIEKALTPQAAPPPQPATPAPAVSPLPSLSAADRERALRLVKRGDEQLAQGGIAQARLFYERAAEAGLALGAMALGATYDPTELERLGVQGLQPEPATAAKWYARARQLGSTEAAQRLQRLGAK
jgi:TPR repeat protein